MSLAVLGATSVIGLETAKVFARAGHDLLLVSRNTRGIDKKPIKKDVGLALVSCVDADISVVENIEPIAQKIIESFDEDPYVLIAAGTLSDSSETNSSVTDLLEVVDVNFRHVAGVIARVSEELERRKRGCIIVLSSVAGDRGRQSNYVYGSAKAGLTTFAEGLRNHLFPVGVHVLTVKSGYVDTPMFRQALGARSNSVPKFLVSRPEKVAQIIFKAASVRKNVVYIGRIWWLIMLVIRNIPESVFKRLRL